MVEEKKTHDVVNETTQEVKYIFDMDRAVKALQEAVDTKFEDANTKCQSNISRGFENAKEKFEDMYLESISSFLEDCKEEMKVLLQEKVTHIHLSEAVTNTVTGTTHPEFEKVLKDCKIFKKTLLVGPAGAGKTTLASQIAEAFGVDLQKYSCSRDSSVHDLLGYKQPTSEEYLQTTFLDVYENGGVFLVDEYDAMPGDMALFFNGVADGSEFISVPHRDSNPKAIKHKDFILILCGNTWGKGSIEYSGRDFQDLALLDRFRLCKTFVDYDIDLEKSMFENHTEAEFFTKHVRRALEGVDSYLSTRNISEIALLRNNDCSIQDILYILSVDLDETYQQNIRSLSIEGTRVTRRNIESINSMVQQGVPPEPPVVPYVVTSQDIARGMEDMRDILRRS